MIVNRYGLHWAEGGIAFLHQQGAAANLISPALTSPFEVHIRPKTLRCPHQIDLTRTIERLPDWISDPLAQALLPVPEAKAIAILDRDGLLLPVIQELSRLCSPVEPLVVPIWWKSPVRANFKYEVTNLTPMVWCDVGLNQTKQMFDHIEFSKIHKRKAVFICREQVPVFGGEVTWIKSDLGGSVLNEPLEAIGAAITKLVMANEIA